MLTRRNFWIALSLVLLSIGAGVAASKKSHAPGGSPVAAQAPVLEFLASDVTEAQPRELRQVLRLSGSLRAVNQAAVKAKVGGEVREVLVREGEAVKAGQVVAKIDPTEYQARLEQAKGGLQAARGQLDIATKARDNNRALVNQGFISQNAFENASSQYDIARANADSAKGVLDVAQKALNDTVVRAPISGLVASRSVQPGEKVAVDARLLDVVDLRQVEMEAAVPTTDILHVALGQEVQVKIEGLPALLAGRVARINPATQAGSRSVLTYIQIDNQDGLLRIGMFGEAQLTLARHAAAVTLPASALRHQAGATFVYAIENGVLTQKPVTPGMQGADQGSGEGGMVEITGGLEAGARVVKNNLGTFKSGTAVRMIAPPAPATVAQK